MKIQVLERDGSVVCQLPNGERIEIAIVSAEDEEVEHSTDKGEAVAALLRHLEMRGCF